MLCQYAKNKRKINKGLCGDMEHIWPHAIMFLMFTIITDAYASILWYFLFDCIICMVQSQFNTVGCTLLKSTGCSTRIIPLSVNRWHCSPLDYWSGLERESYCSYFERDLFRKQLLACYQSVGKKPLKSLSDFVFVYLSVFQVRDSAQTPRYCI